MKVIAIIRQLEKEGWYLVRQSGSHRQFQHLTRSGTVTVAGSLGKELPRGTVVSIWKQAHLRGEK